MTLIPFSCANAWDDMPISVRLRSFLHMVRYDRSPWERIWNTLFLISRNSSLARVCRASAVSCRSTSTFMPSVSRSWSSSQRGLSGSSTEPNARSRPITGCISSGMRHAMLPGRKLQA